MLTSDNFWHRLNLNYFRIVDLSRLSLPILAIAVTLPGLQPLNAAEKISPENSQTQKLNPSDTTTLLKISLPSATAITSDQLNSPALLAQAQTTTPPPTVNAAADNVPEQIVVKDFEVVGSSIFTEQELNQAVKSYRNRPLTLSELFQARSTITKLYTDKGYVSSGAYIPPQELANGTVQIAVLEGKLEEINVSGTEHLSEDYVASRIETAAGKPINVDSLLGALQLLRLDPL
ncbi:MAG: POTRA domain-containing protein, partial [Cyanobacteria bacterium J06631_6]